MPAVLEEKIDETTEIEDTKVEETHDIETESDETEESETEVESDEEEEAENFTADQKNLLRMIINPKTSKQVIGWLAESAGFSGGETKTEIKEAKKDILAEIKETMGDEFEQIPPKAWIAFSRLVDSKLETISQQINDNLQQQVVRESNEATDWLFKTFPDAPKFANAMTKLMTTVVPAKGVSQRTHLQNLYFMAKGQQRFSPEKTESKKFHKIQENAKDVDVKTSGRPDPRSIKQGSARITSREAVEMALKGKRIE